MLAISDEKLAELVGAGQRAMLHAIVENPDNTYAIRLGGMLKSSTKGEVVPEYRTRNEIETAAFVGWDKKVPPLQLLFNDMNKLNLWWDTIRRYLHKTSVLIVLDEQDGELFSGRVITLESGKEVAFIAEVRVSRKGNVILESLDVAFEDVTRPLIQATFDLYLGKAAQQ